MEWLKQLRDQFLELWKGFNNQTKILLGTAVFAVIIGLIFMVNWAGKPEMVTLYSQLTEKEASSISTWLRDANIPYELGSSGTRIMVAENRVHQARIDLAGAGMSPTGGSVGFEIFDQSKLGMTDKERRIQYARAVAGEMERSIELIEGVEFAKVNISLPETSLFVEEEKPATASVLLRVVPGARLNQHNVAAITQLVAGGVDGLSSDNVSVVDTNGNILSDLFANDYPTGRQTQSQFQAQNELEEKIRKSLTQLVGKMYGINNVAITVSAELNFDQKELYEKIYEPNNGDEGLVRSEQKYEEKYEGSASGAVGVPGTESNIPQYQADDTNNPATNFNKEQNTVNYELNEREVRQVVAPGALKNINVAVVVNKDLADEEITKLTSIVSSAIGYDQTRGDSLTVLGMPFDNSLEQEYLEAMKIRQAAETRKLITYGVIGLAGSILLWFVFRQVRKSAIDHRMKLDQLLQQQAEVELAATHELTPEEKARKEMRKELSDLISDKPEDVAELMKTWLMED